MDVYRPGGGGSWKRELGSEVNTRAAYSGGEDWCVVSLVETKKKSRGKLRRTCPRRRRVGMLWGGFL